MGNPVKVEDREEKMFALEKDIVELEHMSWSEFVKLMEWICAMRDWHIEYEDETDEPLAIFAS